jgi:hypothetical protein
MSFRSTLCLLLLGPSVLTSAAPVTGWVSIFDPQNNSPRFVGTTAMTDSPVTTDAHQDCIVANFPAITLADGDSITLSGTVSLDVIMASSNFRVGLFSGGLPQQGVGNPFVGLYSEAATTGATSLKYGHGTHPDHPFGNGTVIQTGFLPGGAGVAANTPITFTLTIARDGNTLDVTSSYTDGSSYNRSGSVNNLPILNTAPDFSFSFNTAGFLLAGSLNGDQASFSSIAVISDGGGNPDTDGDGMPNAHEETYGLNPDVNDANGDLDNDGLTNLQEYRGADGTPGTGDETFPNNPDSDHDGLNDGAELVGGADPLDPDSDGDTLDDGLETNLGSNPTDASSPGRHLLGIDFNRNDRLAAPSQSHFRIIAGSATQGDNAGAYTKTIGPHEVTITQPDGATLEFRGANFSSIHAIPGGDTSVSFLVADFIGTREGVLEIGITNLPAGRYVFRSYHLDPSTGRTLEFAQGSSPTSPNTIQARVGGILMGSVQPTALGSAGLNTTFINDRQVPTIAFAVTHDGLAPLAIQLAATETYRGDRHLLLNGFELFQIPTP